MKQFSLEAARKLSQDFLEFVNQGVSPFHVTDQCRKMLSSNGFQELVENDNWELQRGGKYFFTRNLTTIVAFQIGKQFEPNNTGFKIIGAHTDSPCLRLAPVSKLESNGFQQTCVTTYGGGLWHTWFDRDLTLADNNQYQSALFHYKQPLLKVPNLAIHLTTERNSFAPNTESNLRPIFSSDVYHKLTGQEAPKEQKAQIQKKHYYALLNLIQEQIGVPVENILDLDFFLADTQPAQFFGLNQEFISSPRLDNLFSSYFALRSLINEESNDDSFVNMVCLYDHEECGSTSAQGANSILLTNNMNRIYQLLTKNSTEIKTDSYYKALQNSFIISADMAHGIHPNYSDKHQVNHRVKINEGIVIKINHNQRYATDGVSAAILRALADQVNVPIQDFIVKNDSPCGSTIGPMISAQTGIKTIDIGVPQWGMHSIRETAGVIDAFYYEALFTQFFKAYDKLNHQLLGK